MLSEILDKAREFYQAGQLPRAERACRQVLDVDGDSVPAWFLLGLIGYQSGRDDESVRAFRETLRRKPDYAEAHNNLGISLARQGKLPEAEASFRAALCHRPNYPESLNNLGNSLRDQNRLDEAIEQYSLAARLQPNYAEAHNNLGIAHARARKWEQAAECYRRAVELKPNYAEAHNNLGTALASLKRFDEAVGSFEQALQLKPAYADAHGNLGIAMSEQSRWPEAEAAFRQAVKLAPRAHQAHNNLGNALAQQGRLQEAAACFREAISLNPRFADAHRSLGTVLDEQRDLDGAAESFRRALHWEPDAVDTHNRLGKVLAAQRRYAQALQHFDRAIQLRPDFVEPHVNRALAYLVTGDFAHGWPEYQWRLRGPESQLSPSKAPAWNGEPLESRRILLLAGQDLSDTLQLMRYARLLKERGATVLIQSPQDLIGLLKLCPWIDEVLADDAPPAKCDYEAPLLSLPKVFGTTLATIPTGEPYLHADSQLAESWRQELSYLRAFRVGIQWQTTSGGRFDLRNSIPLTHFAPLAGLADVHLVNLQKGAERDTCGEAPFSITDLGSRLDEAAGLLMDTAAVLTCLDLVITCDSSLAHLAGALGVPVWTALPCAPEWRWLLNREDCPWYPTMRLFRQSEPDDWAPVFERMAAVLREQLAARAEGKADGTAPPLRPATPSALNSEGVRLAERGRLDEAAANFRQALQLRADFPEAHNNLGNALQNQGQLEEALLHLREAVRLREDYPEAHNNLGIVFGKQREFAEAEKEFARAEELRPDFVQAVNNRGLSLLDQRKIAEAEKCFRRAIELQPGYAAAHGNLGHALAEQKRLDDSIACFSEAIRLDPNNAEVHNNLGNALRETKQLDESARCFLKALELRPQYADAHNNLGITRARQSKYDEAIKHYEEALALRPNYPAAHNNLGIALAQQGKRAQSMASYRQALRLKPDYAEAFNNLAIVLTQEGNFGQALDAYQQALDFRQDYPEAHSNLGIALTESGNTGAALEHFDRALQLKDDYPDAHMNRALTYLLVGDFERGWRDYEWRWKCKDFNPRDFKQPLWNGEPLDGRRILLHTEQGLGDTLQFIRYALLVKQRGGVVLVRAPKPLMRLMRHCPFLDGVVVEGGELPGFDVHLPLLSLPHMFGTRLDSIPAGEPYLHADPELVERWRRELSYIDAFKVGINWQGNPKYRGDQRRSIPLAHFASLAAVPGVRLISLQKGYGSEQLRETRFSVSELGAQIDEAAGPFMDTAAILKNLDLFVTSDTALAHLAGGLGVPVWLALPHAPDWRWLLDRGDCPWYPNMRLFRQPEFDNWEPVFEKMAGELTKRLARWRRQPPYRVPLGLGDVIDRLCYLRAKHHNAPGDQMPDELLHLEKYCKDVGDAQQVSDAVAELEELHRTLQSYRIQFMAIAQEASDDRTLTESTLAAAKAECRRDAVIQELNLLGRRLDRNE